MIMDSKASGEYWDMEITGGVFEPGRSISLRGARQHNLKGIDLDFPIGQLTVICGVSGSGKTSLALKTLYAEGQRRYIESFSAYTRQFLQRIDKPSFESLTNLPPSIAITREICTRNNRSTVGTASEILEYLRVVFSNTAILHCYGCNRRVESHSPNTASDYLRRFDGRRSIIGFEISWQSNHELSEILFDLQTSGFIRLITNGKTIHLADDDRQRMASQLEGMGQAIVVVDRLKLGGETGQERLTQSLVTAFERVADSGSGGALVLMDSSTELGMGIAPKFDEKSVVDGVEYSVIRFANSSRCQYCQIDYPLREPRLFNFNSPIGACSNCEGFGEVVAVDMDKVVPDKSLSLNEGAIAVWRTPAYSHELDELRSIANKYKIPLDVPVAKLISKQWRLIQEGVPECNFGGLDGFFSWLDRKKYKMHVRAFLARWRTYSTCLQCKGCRLNRGALAYTLFGKSFAQLCELTIDELMRLFTSGVESEDCFNEMLAAEKRVRYVASEPQRQVIARMEYLRSVGLDYLCLARPLHTLSSGESQRVMMTTLLGSSLVDMLYVFDEPTVGLHPQDTERMANAILGLRDRGNTVILVEHEPHLMRIADRIVEIGPKAGELGGYVTFNGTPNELLDSKSATGEYLSGRRLVQRSARQVGPDWVGMQGATGRNLRVDELSIPLRCLTVMIGPSGSGKSTLVLDTLCPAIDQVFGSDVKFGLPFSGLFGVEQISGCIAIDQSPIPRSLRSSPVTYSKAMDEIRRVFAETLDAKAKRFGIGHFSFNSDLGRCPTCEGLGFTTIDMQFMADVRLPCQDCDGKRFRREVLEVRFRDLSISEVLELCVDQAHSFFRGNARVQEKLIPLIEIGLGYLPLGQSLSTLSAGEAMRLKLSSQMNLGAIGVNNRLGKLIVLDEPTTGLHYSDIERLLKCIDALIDQGHTFLVIEHNQQLIRCSDHLIELGPGAGPNGGKIIATGAVEAIRSERQSVTGPYL